ncbi:MAG: glycosyltransferase family 39 protein, partial [Alphaproteobacteria bacterium]
MAPTAPYLAIAGAVLVLGATSLTDPFGRDQGTYAYIGYALLQGQVPYLDVFQAKPPLTSLIHALALALFGHSMTAIRVLDLLWTLATAILLYRVAAIALRHDGLALVAALAYLLMYYAFGFWDTAITDGWTNLPALAGIAFFARAVAPEGAARRRHIDWYLAGLC